MIHQDGLSTMRQLMKEINNLWKYLLLAYTHIVTYNILSNINKYHQISFSSIIFYLSLSINFLHLSTTVSLLLYIDVCELKNDIIKQNKWKVKCNESILFYYIVHAMELVASIGYNCCWRLRAIVSRQ